MVVQRPVLSVVVPTFEREELLCQCLEDVLMQDYACFETIVVDQTKTHRSDTVRFLDRIAPRIRHVKLNQPSVTAACNVGAGLATGEILVFLDDDVRILDHSLLARHADRFRDPSIGVVAGRVRNPARPQGDRFDPRSGEPIWGWYHTAWDHETETDVVTAPGANMSCRKDLFMKVGGFDEHFTGNAVRFENDFCLRIREAGYRVVFEPSAAVVHEYDSEGGHNNRHLYGTSEESHAWYASYFRNMVYVTVKHMPVRVWPLACWRLWRQHVCNRAFLRKGLPFVSARQRVFVRGVWQGLQAGRRASAHGTRNQ